MAKLTLMQFLDRIETALRGLAGPAERSVEGDDGGVWWTNGDLQAGVYVSTEEGGAFVYFGEAEPQAVSAVDETVDFLRAVLSDEIVVVQALEDERIILHALAPADDPSGVINPLDGVGGGDMATINQLRIFRWSDGGAPAA